MLACHSEAFDDDGMSIEDNEGRYWHDCANKTRKYQMGTLVEPLHDPQWRAVEIVLSIASLI